MKTVLVTGVSGLGRQAFFAQMKDQVIHYDLGEIMGRLAKERGLLFNESNILHAPPSALRSLRALAIEQLMAAAKKDDPTRPRVISVHALFLLKDRLNDGLTAADFAAINPDLVITLIDGPQDIHERLKGHSGEYLHLTVESIVRWQEFEVFFANHLAGHRNHYVVPVNQPDTFLRLVLGEQKPCVYASYPMTHLPDHLVAKKDAFVERLKEHCIVFDPAATESAHNVRSYFEPADLRAIRNHTIVRDLDWFIGINAEAVVAYWPALHIFSSGMNDELRYAYENGRATYMVVEALASGDKPQLSPFTTYKSKMFWSSDEFFAFLAMPAAEQNAFLVMQEEMIDALDMLEQSRQDLTAASFRERCLKALQQSLPDRDVAALEGRIDVMAARLFEDWSQVIAKVKAGKAPAAPEPAAAHGRKSH